MERQRHSAYVEKTVLLTRDVAVILGDPTVRTRIWVTAGWILLAFVP